nr:uncharacterized protein LOC117228821 [Megalopta genalis]
MQAAEMLCNTRVYHLVFLISLAIGHVHSAPYQTLPNIAGYIPVYIRHGNQPLEEINPQLAEAFHEKSAVQQATVLPNVNGPTDSSLVDEASKIKVEAKRIRKAENDVSPIDKICKGSMNKDIDAEIKKYKEISESVNQLRPVMEEDKTVLEKMQAELEDKLKILEIQKGCITDLSQTPKPSTNVDRKIHEIANDNPLQLRMKDGLRIGENILSSIFGGKKNIRNQRYPDRFRDADVPQEILDETERAKKQNLEEKSK